MPYFVQRISIYTVNVLRLFKKMNLKTEVKLISQKQFQSSLRHGYFWMLLDRFPVRIQHKEQMRELEKKTHEIWQKQKGI